MNPDPGTDRFVIHGHVHLSLHAVARCFGVHVSWLEQVYDHGLLGPCMRAENRVAVAATQLDRVARIVRLYFHQGVELTAIVLLLSADEVESQENP